MILSVPPRHVAALVGTYFILTGLGIAHDSWISQGGLRNAAGEWCCGEGDCFVVPADQIRALGNGYHVSFDQKSSTLGGAVTTTHRTSEIVPYAEAQPSPDGQYWRCRRPDGTRRCFFAPPPNT